MAGSEGAGTVTELGEGVEGLAAGDRVAWAMVPGTGYAEQVVVPAARLVLVGSGPDEAALRALAGRQDPLAVAMRERLGAEVALDDVSRR